MRDEEDYSNRKPRQFLSTLVTSAGGKVPCQITSNPCTDRRLSLQRMSRDSHETSMTSTLSSPKWTHPDTRKSLKGHDLLLCNESQEPHRHKRQVNTKKWKISLIVYCNILQLYSTTQYRKVFTFHVNPITVVYKTRIPWEFPNQAARRACLT